MSKSPQDIAELLRQPPTDTVRALDGQHVTAKRLGYDEVLSAVEEFDYEPADMSRGEDLDGVLTMRRITPLGRPAYWIYSVDGQSADPTTIRGEPPASGPGKRGGSKKGKKA